MQTQTNHNTLEVAIGCSSVMACAPALTGNFESEISRYAQFLTASAILNLFASKVVIDYNNNSGEIHIPLDMASVPDADELTDLVCRLILDDTSYKTLKNQDVAARAETLICVLMASAKNLNIVLRYTDEDDVVRQLVLNNVVMLEDGNEYTVATKIPVITFTYEQSSNHAVIPSFDTDMFTLDHDGPDLAFSVNLLMREGISGIRASVESVCAQSRTQNQQMQRPTKRQTYYSRVSPEEQRRQAQLKDSNRSKNKKARKARKANRR